MPTSSVSTASGVSIYPASISSLIRANELCVKKISHPDAYASYALIWSKNHQLSHVAEEFIIHVENRLTQQSPAGALP